MTAFVIQRHEKQDEPVHWDLMLEQGEALKTFRLDQPPRRLMIEPGTATPIFDHDKRFLTYEGSVNQGWGRVTMVDRGEYETIDQTSHRWVVQLQGKVLSGTFALRKKNAAAWDFRNEDRRE